MRSALRSERAPLVALALVTLAGFLLRLLSLGDSLMADEASTYSVVAGRGPAGIVHALNGHSEDLNPPLQFLLAWLTGQVADPPQGYRIAPFLAGIASMPLAYALTRRVAGRGAALTAATLVALSAWLIFYATEARAYGILLVLTAAGTYALLRATRADGARWWVAYGLCAALAMYTHFTAVFLLAFQFAWALLFRPHARRPLLLATGAAALAYAPWLPVLVKNTHSPGAELLGQLVPFNVGTVRRDLSRSTLGHPFIGISQIPGLLAYGLALAGIVVGIAGTAWTAMRARRLPDFLRPSCDASLIFVTALATPVGMALYSLVLPSIWNGRNLIGSRLAVAVLLALVLTGAARPVVRWVAVALVVAGLGVGAVQMLDQSNHRSDFRAAARWVQRTGVPSDPVVDASNLSPGPYQPMGDIALNRARLAPDGSERHPVIRLGSPPLAAKLAAPPYTSIPAAPPAAVAAEAVRRCRPGCRIFLSVFGAPPVALIRSGRAPRKIVRFIGPPGPFLRALPRRFRLTGHRTWPGLVPLSVYVFRAGPSR